MALVSADGRNLVDNIKGRHSKPGFTEDGTLLSAWSGDGINTGRESGRNSYIPDPCLAMLVFVQEDRVKDLYDFKGFANSGLLQRILVCCTRATKTEIGDRPKIPQPLKTHYESIINALLRNFHDNPECKTIECDPEALQLLNEHYNEIVRQESAGEIVGLEEFSARWTEQAWRIALVLHCLENPEHADGGLLLGKETAQAAIEIEGWFREQQKKLVGLKAIDERRAMQEKVIAYILENNGQALQRDIYRYFRTTAVEIESLLQDMEQIEKVKEGRKVTWRIKGSQS